MHNLTKYIYCLSGRRVVSIVLLVRKKIEVKRIYEKRIDFEATETTRNTRIEVRDKFDEKHLDFSHELTKIFNCHRWIPTAEFSDS